MRVPAFFLSLPLAVLAAVAGPATAQEEGETAVCDVDAAFSECGTPSECGLDACGEYSDWLSRPQLLGDLGGLRPRLAESGILYNGVWTQFYQGVAGGGAEQKFAYGGKVDQFLTFSGAPYGNEGFSAILHAGTRYGEDVIAAGGSASPSNVAMLYPKFGSHETAITGLIFQQALSERFALTAGKFNALDLIDMLLHNGRGIDGFMNTSLVLPLSLARTTNLSFLGAGAMVLHEREVQGAVLVYDTNNSTTTSGFDNLFDNGAVVLGMWRFFTEFGGRPGYHMFGGNYSSGKYRTTDRTGFSFIPGQGIVANRVTGSWSLFYIANQQLWAAADDPQRNVAFTGQFGLADNDPNFIRWTASAAIEGKGLIRGREQDRLGVGYFFLGLSGNIKSLVGPLVPLQNVNGVELYYNAAVTPWFHITADLQVIDGANQRLNTAIIPGLRASIVF